VASAHDALCVRAVRDAEAVLGPPPCPYALLILDSGDRREPTLRSDQDRALVLAVHPEHDPLHDALTTAQLFLVLATRLERHGLATLGQLRRVGGVTYRIERPA
jgi:signal-transduction protein with cAMP-binding, CBS, and nucleotidyltransferase domain